MLLALVNEIVLKYRGLSEMKMKFLAAALVATSITLTTPAVNAEVKVSTKGGLSVKSGDYSIKIGGRIQYDYNRSELNGEVDEDDFDARRARLFVSGNVSKDWSYKVNWNVEGDGFEDLFIRYSGFGKGAVVTIGNQHQPFTLSQLISSKDVGISERPGIVERYLIGRREGVQLHGNIDKLHYAVGLFTEEGTDEDNGFAGRIAYAPIKTDYSTLHLGASYKDTEEQDGFGLEIGAVSGPFHIQAEYFDADEFSSIEDEISGVSSTIEESIDGFYVQAGYVITGEKRPYKNGTFKKIKPNSSAGAWEVVARYEDGDGGFGDVELGNTDASSYALGVNYYLNDYIRINASYQEGDSNVTDDDGNEFRVRFQVAF